MSRFVVGDVVHLNSQEWPEMVVTYVDMLGEMGYVGVIWIDHSNRDCQVRLDERVFTKVIPKA